MSGVLDGDEDQNRNGIVDGTENDPSRGFVNLPPPSDWDSANYRGDLVMVLAQFLTRGKLLCRFDTLGEGTTLKLESGASLV